MKRIMILGAGVYQVPLIEKAKELGHYTIVVSIPGSYPGFDIADEVAYIDTTNYMKIYKLAKEIQIDAILTTGTDVALITVGYICDKLNLKGISFESACLSTNKIMMKKAFKENGVNTAEYRIISSYKEAKIVAKDIGYPVVIKVVDKSGSRGITKVDSEEYLREAYEYGRNYTNSEYMIVEKCIKAHEIGVDAFVQNGEIVLFLPHDKLVLNTKRTSIPQGHICPMNFSREMYSELFHQTELVVKSLKLNNCSVNMDVFINKNNIYVIEATGRCGGTGIPEVISAYTNMDFYKIMLDNALGNTVNISKKYNDFYVASFLLFSTKTGKIRNISYNDEILGVDDSIEFDYQQGQMVHSAENGTDRIGMLIAKDNNREKLIQKIQKFNNSLDLLID